MTRNRTATSNAPLIILGVVGTLLVLSMGAGFVVYSNLCERNQREYARMANETEQLSRKIGAIRSDLDQLEINREIQKQEGQPTTHTDREIRRSRELLNDMMESRNCLYGKIDTLWPR